MQCTMFEMGMKDGKMTMVPIKEDIKFTDLKRGQILKWGGNMGYPETDRVILSKFNGYDDKVMYKTIDLIRYENEEDYVPRIAQTEAYSIKDPQDKTLWHGQHIYITDKTLPEQEIVKLEEWAEKIKIKESQEADESEKRREINKSKRNPNLRPVTISLCYDDSDSMTDYYNPKSTMKEWILEEVTQGKRLTSILKRIVDKYPKLSKLQWVEHKSSSYDTFSSSLTSHHIKMLDYVDTEPKLYRGGKAEYGFFMVEFGYYQHDAHHDDWIETPVKVVVNTSKPLTSVTEVTFKKNTDKNGLEIYFPNKPSDQVRDTLKANGFRWGKYNKCWYKRDSEGLEQRMKKELEVN